MGTHSVMLCSWMFTVLCLTLLSVTVNASRFPQTSLPSLNCSFDTPDLCRWVLNAANPTSLRPANLTSLRWQSTLSVAREDLLEIGEERGNEFLLLNLSHAGEISSNITIVSPIFPNKFQHREGRQLLPFCVSFDWKISVKCGSPVGLEMSTIVAKTTNRRRPHKRSFKHGMGRPWKRRLTKPEMLPKGSKMNQKVNKEQVWQGFSESGEWQRERVSIRLPHTRARLAFNPNGYVIDCHDFIGIDDVIVTEGLCNDQIVEPNNKDQISNTSLYTNSPDNHESASWIPSPESDSLSLFHLLPLVHPIASGPEDSYTLSVVNATIWSPRIRTSLTVELCLHFQFKRQIDSSFEDLPEDDPYLTIITDDGAGERNHALWDSQSSGYANVMNQWITHKVSLPKRANFRIGFQGKLKFNSVLFVKNIKISLYPCQNPRRQEFDVQAFSVDYQFNKTVGPLDCNFESDQCQWTSDQSRTSWVRMQPPTRPDRYDRKPQTDRTTDSDAGYYMLAQYANANSKIPRLISPSVPLTSAGRCFQFWSYVNYISNYYRAYLQVYVRAKKGPGTNYKGNLIWNQDKSTGSNWVHNQIFIDQSMIEGSSELEIIFEGRTSIQLTGVAIDDVYSIEGNCPHKSSCDFETADMCGYQNFPAASLTWNRTNALELSSSNAATGYPDTDHTMGTSNGYFAFVQKLGGSSGPPTSYFARLLTSADGLQATTGRCLSVWYHIADATKASLSVSLQEVDGAAAGKMRELWLRHEDKSARWRKAMIDIQSSAKYQVFFQVTYDADTSAAGSFAIDDVSFTDGRCPREATCNFEHDDYPLCGYFNEETLDDFDWERQRGHTGSHGTGPSTDHSTGNENGYYVYIESSYLKPGKKAWLVSEILAPGLYCLNFWYHMSGRDTGDLNVYVNSTERAGSNSAQLVFNRTGEQYEDWLLGMATIDSDTEFDIVFEGVVGSSYLSDIALDDIALYKGKACVQPTPPPNSFTCRNGATNIDIIQVCDFVKDCPDNSDEDRCANSDFETTPDGYTDQSIGEFKWSRGRNGTDTQGTGPTTDNTKKDATGYYMFVDASKGSAYDTAVLQSTMLQQSSSTCRIQFYYHMYSSLGYGPGDLSFNIIMGSITIPMFSISGNRGDQWNLVDMEIGRYEKPFLIEFRARRIWSVRGDIAIDDIKMVSCALPPMNSGLCPKSTDFQCQRRSCISSDRVCDLTDDCGDMSDESPRICSGIDSCNFERSLCDWEHDQSADFEWERVSGPTGTSNTGPTRDHTTGLPSGHYIYIESSYLPGGSEARLLGPVMIMTPEQACRIRFYYHMYGDHTGNLTLYVRTLADRAPKRLWTLHSDQGLDWVRVDVDVGASGFVNVSTGEVFQLVFEGIITNGVRGDIALDDISFTQGCLRSQLPLPTAVPTKVPCTHDEFKCSNGDCIAAGRKCDFAVDCSDGSDEAGCGPCDFEDGMCSWNDKSDSGYIWSWNQGRTPRWYTGPSGDHTRGKYGQGYYMYADGSRGNFLKPAKLVSPPLPASSRLCRITFWFHMYGTSMGTLKVVQYSGNSGTGRELWSISGNQYNTWNTQTVLIGEMPQGFTVGFEASVNKKLSSASQASDIAIDDIFFEECNPQDIPPNLDCKFEEDICKWTDGDIKWKRQKGGTDIPGPRKDHSESGTGYYLYVDTTKTENYGKAAEIISTQQHRTPATGHCLTFWYYMFGPSVYSLEVVLTDDSNRHEYWERQKSQGNTWHQAFVHYTSDVPYILTIAGMTGPKGESNMAIDDIAMVDGHCPKQPVCNFEEDFCDWTQRNDDDFDWQRLPGSYFRYAQTGPKVDHTTGTPNGYLIVAESMFQNKDEVAIIDSIPFSGRNTRCFEFWYHMYGVDIGKLQIYQRLPDGPIPTVLLWTKEGNQGNTWRRGRVTLPRVASYFSSVNYSVSILATTTGDYHGDLALDDIQVFDSACPDTTLCDFESDMCGWANYDTGADFEWLRNNGNTDTDFTGPSFDHTTGTAEGYYVYIESDKGFSWGSAAYLVSEHVDSSFGCLDFWYHMYGTSVGTLTVYVQPEGSGASLPREKEWSISGNQGNVWRNKKIDIVAPRDHYSIIFMGTNGGNKSGDIALDDIDFRPKPCPPQPSTSPPPPPTRPPIYPHTDNDCDFERNFCNWTLATPAVPWIRQNGSTDSIGTGPKVDHTTDTPAGYYIHLDDSGKRFNTSARIYGTEITTSSADGFCFKFWYHMYGQTVNRLSVYVNERNGAQNQLLWTQKGTKGTHWLPAQIRVPKVGSFVVTLEALASPSYKGDIAIDDISVNLGLCPSSDTCDFENGWCRYVQDTGDDFDWTRATGESTNQVSDSSPDLDHTYNTDRGHFIYLETRGQRAGDVAVFDSDVYPATSGACLKFWYFAEHVGVSRLSIHRKVEGVVREELWRVDNDHYYHDWNLAQVTLRSATAYQISFKGTVGASQSGHLAIDDVFVSDKPCQPMLSCNFENSLCDWRNELSRDRYDWELSTGKNLHYLYPKVDHTLGNEYGTFLYADTVYPLINGDKAWYLSQKLPKASKGCLQFYYFTGNYQYGTLSILIELLGDPDLVGAPVNTWSKSGSLGNKWVFAQTYVTEQKYDYRLVFESRVGRYGRDIYALDDIAFLNGVSQCPDPPTEPPPKTFKCPQTDKWLANSQLCDFVFDCPNGEDELKCGYNCTFEADECGWSDTSGANAEFVWKRNRGATPDSNTGPSFDNTKQTAEGWYVYVDATRGSWYEKASYTSPIMRQASATCSMEFYYHMYGSHVGLLMASYKMGSLTTAAWMTAGNQGDKWNRAVLHLGRIPRDFSVIFQGQRTTGELGDIAIDDISFRNCDLPQAVPGGNCSSLLSPDKFNRLGPFTCSNKVCVRRDRICDFEDDCGDGSDENNSTCTREAYGDRCNFEEGLCDWTQDPHDDFDWTRTSASTPNANTGPTRDHTTNSAVGSYLYINSIGKVKGEKARLVSRMMVMTSIDFPCQLRFFYHMYGKDIGALSVSVVIMDEKKVLWTMVGEMHDYWERAQINVEAPGPFQIIIEAAAGAGLAGDIGLDDISFSTECKILDTPLPTGLPTWGPMSTTASPCPEGQWKCSGSGPLQCIPREQVCDWKTQCRDGSDEVNCGDCTFESNNWCGWNDKSTGRYRWDLTQAALSKGPHTDHTTNTSAGFYVYVDSDNGGSGFTRANLISPVLGTSYVDCTMSLWYHRYGDVGGIVMFYVAESSGVTLLARFNPANITDDWVQLNLRIGRRRPGFRLIISTFHFTKSADMALDDFSFNNCAVPEEVTCKPSQFHCKNNHCVDRERICDYEDDCFDNSDEMQCEAYKDRCNFESDWCAWDVSTKNGSWIRSRGSNQATVGPTIDHTCYNESCWFAYFALNQPRTYTATMTSQVFLPLSRGQTCQMRFFIDLYNFNGGGLTIYLDIVGKQRQVLYNKTTSYELDWKREFVSINTTGSPYRVIMEARGNSITRKYYYLALDDITFSPECVPASSIPRTTPVPNNCTAPAERPCRNGKCRPAEDFCNFRHDCADWSDEDDCPSVCNFEGLYNGMCGWSNEANLVPAFDSESLQGWELGSGSTVTRSTGPSVDHTTNSPAGKYVYIDASINFIERNRVEQANLTSPLYSLVGSTCQYSFWYHMYGPQMGTMTVFVKGENERGLMDERQLWIMSNNQGDRWNQAQLPIPPCWKNVQVVIQGRTRSYGAMGDMAVDDLRFDTCAAPQSKQRCGYYEAQCFSGACINSDQLCDFQVDCCGDRFDELPLTCKEYGMCNFENNSTCGWFPDPQVEFTWQMAQQTDSSNTGAEFDHTYGNNTGHFMHIEASYPRRKGDRARLLYYLTDARYGCQLRFWYHMYGRQIGELNINIDSMLAAGAGRKTMWSMEGDQGNFWKRGSVSIYSRVPIAVIIEGVVGSGFLGDIGIDDLSFTEECRANHNDTIPTAFPSIMQDCDFELSMCGMGEAQPDGFDWTRASGATTNDNRNQAPAVDAGRGTPNGMYAYVKNTIGSRVFGKRAILQSSLYNPVPPDCQVRFSYYAEGNAYGTLSLWVQEVGNATKQYLWRVRGNNGPKWKSTTVGLFKRSKNFFIGFELSPSFFYSGRIAIDEIRYTECSNPPAAAKCESSKFWCVYSRACIDSDRYCDLVDNCGDNSDESSYNCRTFTQEDFEVDTQIFRQGINGVEDQADWVIQRGGTGSVGTGPSADHTRGNQEGRYMLMDSDTIRYGRKAWLVTTEAFNSTTSSKPCQMRMYYQMNGPYVNELRISTRVFRDGSPTRTYVTFKGNHGSVWLRQVVNFEEALPFQVIIEGTMGDPYQSDLALDDITFTSSCTKLNASLLPLAPVVTTTTSGPTTIHPCGVDQFGCLSSGQCIPKAKVCNFIDDCGDYSDEEMCASPTCDFNDDNLCNWDPGHGGDPLQYAWARGRGDDLPTDMPTYRPSVDAQGQSSGYYVYADSALGKVREQANFTSPYIGQTGPQCKLLFFYWANGPFVGSLHMLVQGRNEDKPTQLWAKTGSSRDIWENGGVFIGARTDFKVILQARRGFQYKGDIALDNPEFQDCKPPQPSPHGCINNQYTCDNMVCINPKKLCNFGDDCGDRSDEDSTKCLSYPGRCDFEHGLCQESWNKDTTGTFDWTFSIAGTPSSSTGAEIDHTTYSKDGHYLYIESSYPRIKGDTARLKSFVIKGSSTDCWVRYWYHMKGDDIGKLSTYIRTSYNPSDLYLVNSHENHQSPWWVLEELELDLTAQSMAKGKDYEIVIEGVVGKGFKGDITIDDFSLTPGCIKSADDLPGSPTRPPTTESPCGAGMFRCNNGTCLLGSQLCDFRADCSTGEDEAQCGGNCTFETGMCGWTNSSGLNMFWSRANAKSDKGWGTGPSTDHTRGDENGYYAMVKVSNRQVTNARAHLQSGLFHGSDIMCRIRFFYHMYGSAVGSLRLLMKSPSGISAPKWEMSGNQGDKWIEQVVDIGPMNDFSIIFEVEHFTYSSRGDVAVDDITYENCFLEDSIKECGPNQFRCANMLQCIPKSNRCDGQTLCADGSDELNCPIVTGNCQFEGDNWASKCNYVVRDDADCDWTVRSSSIDESGGPSADHTTGIGQFAVIGPQCSRFGDNSMMETPLLKALTNNKEECLVRFWYYMNDPGSPIGSDQNMGRLNVYLQDYNQQQFLLWRQTGNQGPHWNYASIPVGQSKEYKVVFEAQKGGGKASDVSIDDVSFSEACLGGAVNPDKNKTCDLDYFLCAKNSVPTCIPKHWLCDGDKDCDDGSDELNCVSPPITAKPHTGGSGSDSRIILIASFFAVLLVVVVVILAFVYYRHRQRNPPPTSTPINQGGVSIDNPIFEMNEGTGFEVNVFDR